MSASWLNSLVSGRSRLDLWAERRAAEIVTAVAGDLRRLLDDTGVRPADVARASHVSPDMVSRILRGERQASIQTLARIALALGGDLSVRLAPGAGVAIHDRVQARMVDAFVPDLDARWTPFPEVPVRTPARGAIDLVIVDSRDGSFVAVEFQSQLRRAEQTLRWSNEKAAALSATDLYRMATTAAGAPPPVHRLLVLRSTQATRAVVRELPALFAAAYPVPAGSAVTALRGRSALQGDALVWMHMHGRSARLMDGLPVALRGRMTHR
jgi:transcriptional regulator with XRE-family HTH domain